MLSDLDRCINLLTSSGSKLTNIIRTISRDKLLALEWREVLEYENCICRYCQEIEVHKSPDMVAVDQGAFLERLERLYTSWEVSRVRMA